MVPLTSLPDIWNRNGSQTASITALPGRNDAFADAYWFPLHELLTKEGVGEPFLEAIRKEMQGGIDLEQALRDAGGIETFSGKRHALARTLKEKQGLVNDQEKTILDNLDLQKNITNLQNELEKIRTKKLRSPSGNLA